MTEKERKTLLKTIKITAIILLTGLTISGILWSIALKKPIRIDYYGVEIQITPEVCAWSCIFWFGVSACIIFSTYLRLHPEIAYLFFNLLFYILLAGYIMALTSFLQFFYSPILPSLIYDAFLIVRDTEGLPINDFEIKVIVESLYTISIILWFLSLILFILEFVRIREKGGDKKE